MLRLLERSIATIDERLVLLAPPHASIPEFFEHVTTDSRRHGELLREVQRLRGSVYLRDGALEKHQLSVDGLHETPEDERSWHLLALDPQHRQITAGVWYLEHDNGVRPDDLRVRSCPLARHATWRGRLQRAIESEITRARQYGLRYSELGGWAVAEERRRSPEGLVLALAAYSLGRICGGALGLTTATVRHCSSTILRRLGGSPLKVDGISVPPYYDPKYKCMMEILRFDSRRPSARYVGLIELLKEKLASVLVVSDQTVEAGMASFTVTAESTHPIFAA